MTKSLLNVLTEIQLETLYLIRRNGKQSSSSSNKGLPTFYALLKKGYIASIGDHSAYPHLGLWVINNNGVAFLNALEAEVADHDLSSQTPTSNPQ